jgi:hypothetical protein
VKQEELEKLQEEEEKITEPGYLKLEHEHVDEAGNPSIVKLAAPKQIDWNSKKINEFPKAVKDTTTSLSVNGWFGIPKYWGELTDKEKMNDFLILMLLENMTAI